MSALEKTEIELEYSYMDIKLELGEQLISISIFLALQNIHSLCTLIMIINIDVLYLNQYYIEDKDG